MSLFMDRHDIRDVTAEDVAEAHKEDLKVQDKHGCKAMTYWFDQSRGTVFCLIEAPTADAVREMHREAHGLIPHEVIEVDEKTVSLFLGRVTDPSDDGVLSESAFRALVFAEIADTAKLIADFGDDDAFEMIEQCMETVSGNASRFGGKVVEKRSDGFLMSFGSATKAVQCGVEIQKTLAEGAASTARPVCLRIGIGAGEPIVRGGSLFGTVVTQTKQICHMARPGQILVSAAVRDLCRGKSFPFSGAGSHTLDGSEDPLSLFEAIWDGSPGSEVGRPADTMKAGSAKPVTSGISENLRTDRFELVRELGRGGMGVAFLARDSVLHRDVVLKFLSPHLATDKEARHRFILEAEAASAINHPNICSIFDIGENSEGRSFIAMAYYEGENLHDRIATGPLGVDEAVDIGVQVASGLAAAHEKGIVHRDIKPANIFLTKQGRAVILDFGLAKLNGSTGVTKTGSTLGTVGYMAPEQLRGESPDERSDVWSLGVVIHEMCAGTRPFAGDYEAAIMYSIANADPQPLLEVCPDATPELEEVIARALRKRRDERFQTAADFEQSLRSVVAHRAS